MNGRSRLLAAVAGAAVDATPVWFMRQAGGRLPAYRALRARHSVLDIVRDPQRCAEVSLAPVETLGVDGAVMFADIMLIVGAMGVAYELTDEGPRIASPIADRDAIDRLRPVELAGDLATVVEAIGRVRRELDGRAAVIGIVGGPFTLASYLLEGGPSRDHLRARALLHGDPGAWSVLMARLAEATIAYARAQAAAGADVIQLFDTWASALTAEEFGRSVAPASRRILAAVPVPTIHSVARSEAILDEVAACGATVVHVDSRQSLAAARARLGRARPVQGNLDPALLLAGPQLARRAALDILRRAGPRGHVFGTGEALPRDIEPTILRDLTSAVHEASAAAGAVA